MLCLVPATVLPASPLRQAPASRRRILQGSRSTPTRSSIKDGWQNSLWLEAGLMPCLMLCFWYATWVCAQLSEGPGQTGQDLIKCCMNFKPPDSSQSLITRSPKTSSGPKKKKRFLGNGQQLSMERGLKLPTYSEYNTSVVHSGRLLTVLRKGSGEEERMCPQK